jgi:hypothetical protein
MGLNAASSEKKAHRFGKAKLQLYRFSIGLMIFSGVNAANIFLF